MNENEFARLVWSIRKIGQIRPTRVDENDRIIDGRYRFLACQIAGVEPKLAPPKDGAVAYWFAANVARRHLSIGQRAMVAAIVLNLDIPDDGFVERILSENLGRAHYGQGALRIADALVHEPDFPDALVLSEAKAVVRHGAFTKQVAHGTLPLSEAYKRVVENERERTRLAEGLASLRLGAPFLALQVEEGALAVEDALVQMEMDAAAPILAEQAQAIRVLGRRMISDAIEIGRRLSECRRLIRRDWIGWLDRELGLSDRSALDFIRIYELRLPDPKTFRILTFR
jgi:hypothetical protein